MTDTATDAPTIEFGKVYRDSITGFEGICTGKSQYITGCDQILIVPKVDNEGKFQSGQWFDDSRLVDVEAEKAVATSQKPGGPQHTPPRSA